MMSCAAYSSLFLIVPNLRAINRPKLKEQQEGDCDCGPPPNSEVLILLGDNWGKDAYCTDQNGRDADRWVPFPPLVGGLNACVGVHRALLSQETAALKTPRQFPPSIFAEAPTGNSER